MYYGFVNVKLFSPQVIRLTERLRKWGFITCTKVLQKRRFRETRIILSMTPEVRQEEYSGQ